MLREVGPDSRAGKRFSASRHLKWLWLLPAASFLWFAYYSKHESEEAEEPSHELVMPYPRAPLGWANDKEVLTISTQLKDTDIKSILEWKRPADLANLQGEHPIHGRVSPYETTIWRLRATVTDVVLREDHDYYLTIEDEAGRRTVVEIPEPEKIQGSVFRDQIQRARRAVEGVIVPTARPAKVHMGVEVTGIGFFGRTGKSPDGSRNNGARIYPALSIRWL
jgi:hypothetical protein